MVKQRTLMFNDKNVLEKCKMKYQKQLDKLRQLKQMHLLNRQNIQMQRFDHFCQSLKTTVGQFQLIQGAIDFSTPWNEQFIILNESEQLLFHYLSAVSLLSMRQHEFQGLHDEYQVSNKLLEANL